MARQLGELNRKDSLLLGIPATAIGIGAMALVGLTVHNPDAALYAPGAVLTTVGTLSIIHGLLVK